jgi:hypothetical protein
MTVNKQTSESPYMQTYLAVRNETDNLVGRPLKKRKLQKDPPRPFFPKRDYFLTTFGYWEDCYNNLEKKRGIRWMTLFRTAIQSCCNILGDWSDGFINTTDAGSIRMLKFHGSIGDYRRMEVDLFQDCFYYYMERPSHLHSTPMKYGWQNYPKKSFRFALFHQLYRQWEGESDNF